MSSPGCASTVWCTKLAPMNPAPPVIRSFTAPMLGNGRVFPRADSPGARRRPTTIAVVKEPKEVVTGVDGGPAQASDPPDIDELVARLRARVEARRREGTYP